LEREKGFAARVLLRHAQRSRQVSSQPRTQVLLALRQCFA
jgi:hypothetical protein